VILAPMIFFRAMELVLPKACSTITLCDLDVKFSIGYEFIILAKASSKLLPVELSRWLYNFF